MQIPLCRVCSNKVYMHEKKILLNRGTVAIPFLTEYSFTPFVCLSHEKVTTHCTPFFCQLSGGLFFCICFMRKRIILLLLYPFSPFKLWFVCECTCQAHADAHTHTYTRTHAHFQMHVKIPPQLIFFLSRFLLQLSKPRSHRKYPQWWCS